jgi:small GTP-binding protein
MGSCATKQTKDIQPSVIRQEPVTNDEYDFMCKLLLLGDSGVGKSSLMLRFSDNQFKSTFINTIGVDFKIKNLVIKGKRVKVQIWDTAGQERFRTITKTYYRGAQAYVLVYDITDRNSFDHIKYWLSEIQKHGNEFVPKIIVGNKSDLEEKRAVPSDEGKKFADERSVSFMETSARDGNNVQEMFMKLIEMWLDTALNQQPNSKN